MGGARHQALRPTSCASRPGPPPPPRRLRAPPTTVHILPRSCSSSDGPPLKNLDFATTSCDITAILCQYFAAYESKDAIFVSQQPMHPSALGSQAPAKTTSKNKGGSHTWQQNMN